MLAEEEVLASGCYPEVWPGLGTLVADSGPGVELVGSDPQLRVWAAGALGVADSESLGQL